MLSKHRRKYIITLFLWFQIGTVLLYGQEEAPVKQTIEDLIEDIASSTDAELDYSSLYDDLNYFLNNRINLNNTNTGCELINIKLYQVIGNFLLNHQFSFFNAINK